MDLQLLRKRLMRLVILTDHEQPRRVHIDAMHDARTHHSVDRAELRTTVIHHRIHEGPLRMPRRRMHDHTLRLIHDQHILILVDDVERDVLRLHVERHRRRQIQRQHIARLQLRARFRRLPVQEDTLLLQ